MRVKVVHIKVNGGAQGFKRRELKKIMAAAVSMGNATLNRSFMTIPEKTQAMRKTGKVKKEGNSIIVKYGGKPASAYTHIQENKRFKNYTKPGSGPHFLKDAGDSVAKEGIRAFMD